MSKHSKEDEASMLRESPRSATKTGAGPSWLGEERLNRALVAGLMLDVMYSQPTLSEDPGARRGQVKSRLKTALVPHLAGHILLSSFRDLAQNLDHWFDLFYPLVTPQDSRARTSRKGRDEMPQASHQLREPQFLDALTQLNGVLPTRRHRKIDEDKLLAFFRQCGGDWFRLKDFERFFRIDRKTAWEYTQKLLQADLLTHNHCRSAAVRYCLAERFLNGQPSAVISQ
jgi:hypothetical protein